MIETVTNQRPLKTHDQINTLIKELSSDATKAEAIEILVSAKADNVTDSLIRDALTDCEKGDRRDTLLWLLSDL